MLPWQLYLMGSAQLLLPAFTAHIRAWQWQQQPDRERLSDQQGPSAAAACHINTAVCCCFPAAVCAPPPPTPTPQALKEKRSCKLVPECISAKKEVLTLVATQSDATAHVAAAAAAGGGRPVKCAPLSDLLARYAGSPQQRVDVWILDVEVGYIKGRGRVEVTREVGLCDGMQHSSMPKVRAIRPLLSCE